MKALAALFWNQIEWIRPESYMGDGDYLNFVRHGQALSSPVFVAL